MRILVLTFYFTPDLSAGSFRSTSFVAELSKKIGENGQIDVITSQPNRYSSYKQQAEAQEKNGNVSITRITIPTHKSGMKDQVIAFFSFYRSALAICKDKHYDVVYATSSRLMTAFLGARIAKKVGASLYLDIRDIFVDTLKDVLTSRPMRLLVPLFSFIEQRTIKKAKRVNLVSAGFLPYFQSRYSRKEYDVYTNGIDPEFLIKFENDRPSVPPITVLYAGNIGAGQGLHRIIPDIAADHKETYRFLVIGDGGMKENLQRTILEKKLTNVELIPPVQRQQLLEYYEKADVLFLHLNDLPAFEKVLPSKIFEYAALGKPILAGVSGYASLFLSEEVPWASVFAPCDVSAGIEALAQASTKRPDRAMLHSFREKYDRTQIMRQQVDAVLQLVPPGKAS